MEALLPLKALKYFENIFNLILKEILGFFHIFFPDFIKCSDNLIISM